jgi:hypothetical protein
MDLSFYRNFGSLKTEHLTNSGNLNRVAGNTLACLVFNLLNRSIVCEKTKVNITVEKYFFRIQITRTLNKVKYLTKQKLKKEQELNIITFTNRQIPKSKVHTFSHTRKTTGPTRSSGFTYFKTLQC